MSDKKTILLVEDEASLLQALKDKLTLSGFDVLEARNGEQGLDMALEKHPDLIILDVIMPRMDGLAMLEQLREDEWGIKAKVIFLTNLSDSAKVEKASKEWGYEYLVKSNEKIEDVVAKIRETLK